jgi:hypothetical protein
MNPMVSIYRKRRLAHCTVPFQFCACNAVLPAGTRSRQELKSKKRGQVLIALTGGDRPGVNEHFSIFQRVETIKLATDADRLSLSPELSELSSVCSMRWHATSSKRAN